MDEIAEVVVVIVGTVVGFQAVVWDGRFIVVGQDIVCGAEGEQFTARFSNLTQFVVLEMRCARPLVGTVGVRLPVRS